MSDTSGLFYPTEIQRRVGSGSWVVATDSGAFQSLAPASISYTGVGASVQSSGTITVSQCTYLQINGIFRPGFRDYMALVWCSGTDAPGQLYGRLSANGIPNATANSYSRQYIDVTSTNIYVGRRIDNDAFYAFAGNINRNTAQTIYFYSPFLAEQTTVRTVSQWDYGTAEIFDTAFCHNIAQSYDGLAIYDAAPAGSYDISFYGLV